MSGAGEGKTILPIEWTNQHGCGHGDLNCNIVLQYKCQPTTITEEHRIMRNGMHNLSRINLARCNPILTLILSAILNHGTPSI